MADYYSVIRRAVAALEINTFEDRHAVYNRARAVQSYELRKRPFNKTDFDRERSMLEDAIGRVEAEATNKRLITYASPRAPVQLKRHRPFLCPTSTMVFRAQTSPSSPSPVILSREESPQNKGVDCISLRLDNVIISSNLD